jgi:2Fe-2S ferredoxin|tara:strand:- start:633 stop:953 length:321 start_codon:yes stop_codon:yes gene_type:complete
MPKITYISHDGKKNVVEVPIGLSVMEGAIQNNIEGIDADCGGSMACATCHVYISENWFNKLATIHEAEKDMLDMAHEPRKNSRLSCQIIVADDLDGLEVTTPIKQS